MNTIHLECFQIIYAGSSKYGPKVPVILQFPGPAFCRSTNIFLLVATILPTARKVSYFIE
jgi:hypothetical protein